MPKKVLVIEDRRENIVFIANNILKPEGYEVITARDGKIGLEKAQTENPDLIITDLKLPQLGGLEVMEKLLELDIHIPTIVMTFHGTEETAKQALRLGAKDYLIKPFTMDEMHEALARAFRGPSPSQDQPDVDVDVTELEAELARTKTLLADREAELEQIGKQLSNSIGKAEAAEMAQRAAIWEEENARLNDLLAQTKESEGRAHALEETLLAQKTQLNNYQEEIQRLAKELNNVSQAVRLMAQDMEHQIERLDVMIPRGKNKAKS